MVMRGLYGIPTVWFLLSACTVAPYPYDIEKAYPYRYTLYSLNEGDGTLSFIGLKTTESALRIYEFHADDAESVPIGDGPAALDFHYPSGTNGLYPDAVIVLNRRGRDVALVDTGAKKVTGRIALPADSDPVDMAYAGGLIYVAERANNRLFLSAPTADFSGGSVSSVALGITPTGIRSAGGLLYVIGENDRTLITVSGSVTQPAAFPNEGIPKDIRYADPTYRTQNSWFWEGGYGGIIDVGTYLLTFSPNSIYQAQWGTFTTTSAGRALTASVSSSLTPKSLFIVPDGNNLFVSFRESGGLFWYGESGSFYPYLGLSESPGGITSLPSGNMVFLSLPSRNTIVAKSLRGISVYSEIPTGVSPGAMAVTFSPAKSPGAGAL